MTTTVASHCSLAAFLQNSISMYIKFISTQKVKRINLVFNKFIQFFKLKFVSHIIMQYE